MTDWCILRTQPRHTLRLAASLAEDGFEVWTPVEIEKVQKARPKIVVEVPRAILTGFIFAKTAHIVDLLNLAQMPVKPRRGACLRLPAHVGFSVMHNDEGVNLVRDEHLAPLRRIEARRKPRSRSKYAIPRGVSIRVSSGIYAGMTGCVIRSDTGKTVVNFGGFFGKTEIETSILLWDDVRTDQPCISDGTRKAA